MSTFTGNAVNVFAAAAIKTALKLYAKTGMQVNRAYTPRNMIAAASRITGKTFKARDYLGAAQALEEWIASQANEEMTISAQV
jgi:hypothetical protein